MATTEKNGSKYVVKVEYKVDYDTAGDFPTLGDYTQTFSNVSETATAAQLKDFADTLMSLTVYAEAPYKVFIIDTAELVLVP